MAFTSSVTGGSTKSRGYTQLDSKKRRRHGASCTEFTMMTDTGDIASRTKLPTGCQCYICQRMLRNNKAMMELVKQNRRLIMQYLGLFFTFTFPGILIGIMLTYGKFLKDDEED